MLAKQSIQQKSGIVRLQTTDEARSLVIRGSLELRKEIEAEQAQTEARIKTILTSWRLNKYNFQAQQGKWVPFTASRPDREIKAFTSVHINDLIRQTRIGHFLLEILKR